MWGVHKMVYMCLDFTLKVIGVTKQASKCFMVTKNIFINNKLVKIFVI